MYYCHDVMFLFGALSLCGCNWMHTKWRFLWKWQQNKMKDNNLGRLRRSPSFWMHILHRAKLLQFWPPHDLYFQLNLAQARFAGEQRALTQCINQWCLKLFVKQDSQNSYTNYPVSVSRHSLDSGKSALWQKEESMLCSHAADNPKMSCMIFFLDLIYMCQQASWRHTASLSNV